MADDNPGPLTPDERDLINFVVNSVTAKAGSSRVSGKRLRAKGFKTEAILKLSPTYIHAIGIDPYDDYQATLQGILASERENDARRVLFSVWRTLLDKFRDDPDFYWFSWPDLRAHATTPPSDDELQFFDFIIKLADLADRASSEGNPPVWGWYIPQNIEALVRRTRIGDLNDFIKVACDLKEEKEQSRISSLQDFAPSGDALGLGSDVPSIPRVRTVVPGFHPSIEEKLRQGVGPGIADCYRQALTDLEDPHRISFVGPATELRLVITSTLHTLAPDDAVVALREPAAKATQITMRERALFIMREKAREGVRTRPAEVALERIQGLEGLAKDLYDGTNKGAHTTRLDRDELRSLFAYSSGLLLDLL